MGKLDGLVEQAKAERVREPRCPIAKIKATLDADDAAQLEAAAASNDVPQVALARILQRQLGVTVQPFSIGRHRKGDCACGGTQ